MLLKNIDALIFQRSRSKWLKEGDSNVRFFHNCISARKRSNRLLTLKTANGWVEGPIPIRREVVSFFKNHFGNEEWHRPNLDGIVFPQLSDAEVGDLTASFTMEEITVVVKKSDGSKSPEPDGFNFAFFKEFWNLLKGEVLTARLAKVIGGLIPNTQSAFIKGRQLVDSVVVVNEIIDYAKKSKKECMVLKVDFEKAYDSVDWGFLDYMLERFGFGDKWRAWMKACVCSGNMSVLVNGSPTEEICIKRGLKQGDPLAPFLFMRTAVDRGRFKPFLVGRSGFSVSIL
ncbi:hypothetical protein QL285_001964 [Trifolium repens]|nr:hypothetical protein QL285_001964 [Trifolium repens]